MIRPCRFARSIAPGLLAFVASILFAEPAGAVFTRARITGPLHFAACGQQAAIQIRYDESFYPPGATPPIAAGFLGGGDVPPACQIDPTSIACIEALPDRAVIPNPTAMTFTARPELEGAIFRLMFVAVSPGGDFVYTRVERITFEACPPVAAALQPGAGFSLAAPADSIIGSLTSPHRNDPVTARWDVVPDERISQPVNIGVVAAHAAGIDRVEFSLNGGSVISVTEERINSDTGVKEYYVRLNPQAVPDGTPLIIRARAVPNEGKDRHLARPRSEATIKTGTYELRLFANANETLQSREVFLSPSGSDSIGNGTLQQPFRTFYKAVDTLKTLLGGTVSGGRISLLPGTYLFGSGFYSAPGGFEAPTPNGYITIAPATGIRPSQVRFIGRDCFDFFGATHVKIENVTAMPPMGWGDVFTDASTPKDAFYYTRGVNFVGPSPSSNHGWVGGVLAHFSVGDYFTKGLTGPAGARLVRDSYTYLTSGVAYMNNPLLLNVFSEYIDHGLYPGSHGDVVHVHGEAFHNEADPGGNIYISGLRAGPDITAAQGLFLSPETGQLRSVAVRDSVFDLAAGEKFPPNPHAPSWVVGGITEGLFVSNSLFVGAANYAASFQIPSGNTAVVEDTDFAWSSCSTVFDDCPNNTSGTIYRSGNRSASPSSKLSSNVLQSPRNAVYRIDPPAETQEQLLPLNTIKQIIAAGFDRRTASKLMRKVRNARKRIDIGRRSLLLQGSSAQLR